MRDREVFLRVYTLLCACCWKVWVFPCFTSECLQGPEVGHTWAGWVNRIRVETSLFFWNRPPLSAFIITFNTAETAEFISCRFPLTHLLFYFLLSPFVLQVNFKHLKLGAETSGEPAPWVVWVQNHTINCQKTVQLKFPQKFLIWKARKWSIFVADCVKPRLRSVEISRSLRGDLFSEAKAAWNHSYFTSEPSAPPLPHKSCPRATPQVEFWHTSWHVLHCVFVSVFTIVLLALASYVYGKKRAVFFLWTLLLRRKSTKTARLITLSFSHRASPHFSSPRAQLYQRLQSVKLLACRCHSHPFMAPVGWLEVQKDDTWSLTLKKRIQRGDSFVRLQLLKMR